MLIRFLFAAALFVSACQPSTAATVETINTPEVADTPTVQTTEDSSAAVQSPVWIETEMYGVTIGMWKPAGWETDQNRGLVLAERVNAIPGPLKGGMLIHCFVPDVTEFNLDGDDEPNFALAVLGKVMQMPNHTGSDVAFSQPVGFIWSDHQAAYYLLATGAGIRGLVLAVALPDERKVVACNLSISAGQANRIREMLPQLLDGLTIAGSIMSGDGLDALPEPLPFPRYTPSGYHPPAGSP